MNKDNMTKLAALHRHWIVADSVRAVLQQKVTTPKQEELAIQKFGSDYIAFGEHASMLCRMQVWYSLLYVVVEGYRALEQKYAPLEELLANGEFVDLLRRYRNATFHYQTDALNDKVIDFLNKENSEVWIRDLNKQLEAFLMWALPIGEAVKKMEESGLPKVPPGTKLSTLFQRGKE
ncbi:hypothetical protein PS943_05922 [Pseudomonas fluorescens]|uniref:Uncharacterized protein n=1 Tax=Pseudomonas fluorescens TaxID=294 RepID=A0A5E7WTC6_PSEFL|nr:hypothetical protein [Pseudomonas fluorescens]VVQ38478.1 hypothetical protein PS943_05922 [Pseudomonas fluorescens]